MTSLQRLLKMRRPASLRTIRPGFIVLGLVVSGCGSGNYVAPPAATPPANTGPVTYFAGSVSGASGTSIGFTNQLGTYTIDDSAGVFSQSSYLFGTTLTLGTQNGPQVNFSGTVAPLARGLLSLTTTASQGASGLAPDTPPGTGNWAIELPGRAGGLAELNGLPFQPLVAANTCPTSSTAQNFNFVTLPDIGTSSFPAWSPILDTAYGTVSLSGDGTNALFSNIAQYNIAGAEIRSYPDISITPFPPAYTSISGFCSPTFYGNTIAVTGTQAITNPGVGEVVENSATVGIGPSGMLVESNGNGYTKPGGTSATVLPIFQPFMGAGTGAVGLPVPTSALAVSDLVGAQYLGFFYGFNGVETSTVASFGFPSPVPSTCAAVAASTSSLIYGGDFANNDPSAAAVQSNGGFGNCDIALDLGAPGAQAGLFPNVTVTEGASFAGSTGTQVLTGVAIAGSLNGKFAIFVITSTAQGIYLLQSN